MAFLSLGLNDEHPNLTEEKLHLVDKRTEAPSPVEANKANGNAAPPNGSSRNGQLVNPESQILKQTDSSEKILAPILSPKDHANGNNGHSPNAANNADSSSEDETQKDDWSERGMQIIQSVLLKAQSEAPPSAPAQNSAASELPAASAQLPFAIEELRKQISQGIAPNFRTAPLANGEISPEIHPKLEQSAPEPQQVEELAERLKVETPVDAELPRSPVSPESSASGQLPELMKQLQEKLASPEASAAVAEIASAKGTEAVHAASTVASTSALSSKPEDPISNVPANVLSSVMEEIQEKLARPENAQAGTPAPPQSDLSEAPDPRQEQEISAGSNFDDIPKFATFKFGYLPGRGLLYSIIGHEAAMFALFLFISYILPSFQGQKLIVGSLSSQDHIIYLPEVGGGEQGQKSPGGGISKPQQASAAPARASKGFAYPGRQPILSSPPNPTNAFQTVLRPLVVHPEPLRKLVPLPNVVQMAETRLPNDLIATKAAMPRFQAPAVPVKVRQDSNLHRNAKWNVPVKAPQLLAKSEMPKLAAAEQPLPVAPKVPPKASPTPPEEKHPEAVKPTPVKVAAEKRAEKKSEKEVAPPSEAQIARLEMHGKSAEPLLSLSPAPLPQNANAKVPAGEARGRFAIAPGGRLNPNSVTAGKQSGTPSESPATGQEKSQAANAATELAANSGTGAGHSPTAGGGSGTSKAASGGGAAGAGSGSGNTAGAGVGGPGTGNGRGAAGEGAGRSGHGAGTGAGAGSGAGTGSFPGITIQGGEGNEGTESHGFTVAQQTPYQMTIVATASSGGGLADFGVFENQRVYTVYIPMQRTPQEADPTWTLQYALDSQPGSEDGQLIAPSPVIREWPQIPPELSKTYSQQQVVIYAILNTEGKLTHISVKQTPDAQVSTPIEKALAKWVFRPAQLDNKPVPVKILVGIPL